MSSLPGAPATVPSPSAAPAGGGVRVAPSARRRLAATLQARGGTPQAVWVRPDGGGGFGLVLVDRDDARGPAWLHDETGEVPVVWARGDAPALRGALVDHVDGGFRVRPAPASDAELATLVKEALEEGVNPLVASHGGKVRLVEAVDGVARVRMDGGCQGCMSARSTLADVVSRHLLHGVPGLRDVVDVTDHAAGENPYHRPDRKGVVSLPVLPDPWLREAMT